jgi:hypothetical protein
MSGDPPANVPIRVESAAREYLDTRGGAVTVRGSRRHGCCGGTAFVPVAEAGPPADADGYRILEVDGITVYLERNVVAGPEPLVVGLDGLWTWRRLRVDGTAIWM